MRETDIYTDRETDRQGLNEREKGAGEQKLTERLTQRQRLRKRENIKTEKEREIKEGN